MSLIFSRTCEYALQAVLFLARQENDKPVRLQDLATALRIPRDFLSKIMQSLTHHEIVLSYRGRGGGFTLAKTAHNINAIDIVRAIDGDAFFNQCIMGFPGCSDDRPCPMHSYWKEAKQIILTMLNEQSIDTLSKEMDEKLSLLRLNAT